MRFPWWLVWIGAIFMLMGAYSAIGIYSPDARRCFAAGGSHYNVFLGLCTRVIILQVPQ